MKEYEFQNSKFLDVDLIDDCSNITITRYDSPVVLVRDEGDEMIVNVVTFIKRPIRVKVNNREVEL